MRILKVQNSLVQQKNQFVEHELQKKHLVVKKLSDINTSRPNPGRRGKKVKFLFSHFMKAFIKPFEAPQRSVKIKIQLNFYFNTTFRNARVFKG